MSEACETCEGEGTVPVLYHECRGIVCSTDAAGSLAGEVHHYECCPDCGGDGEIEEAGNENLQQLRSQARLG